MAPKAKGVSLALFTPTDEELTAARAILSANEGQLRSRMQSMTNWLKKNKDGEGNEFAAQITRTMSPSVP